MQGGGTAKRVDLDDGTDRNSERGADLEFGGKRLETRKIHKFIANQRMSSADDEVKEEEDVDLDDDDLNMSRDLDREGATSRGDPEFTT